MSKLCSAIGWNPMRDPACCAAGRISKAELTEASRRLLSALRAGAAAGQFMDITTPGWDQSRTVLDDVSRSHATLGLTPSETATFVFSLKEPLFASLRRKIGTDPDRLAHEIWLATSLLDKLGLYTVEAFQKSREEIIAASSRSCSSSPRRSCGCGRASSPCR